jgi:hypothetical protein
MSSVSINTLTPWCHLIVIMFPNGEHHGCRRNKSKMPNWPDEIGLHGFISSDHSFTCSPDVRSDPPFRWKAGRHLDNICMFRTSGKKPDSKRSDGNICRRDGEGVRGLSLRHLQYERRYHPSIQGRTKIPSLPATGILVLTFFRSCSGEQNAGDRQVRHCILLFLPRYIKWNTEPRRYTELWS